MLSSYRFHFSTSNTTQLKYWLTYPFRCGFSSSSLLLFSGVHLGSSLKSRMAWTYCIKRINQSAVPS